jgi:hypothetical protein
MRPSMRTYVPSLVSCNRGLLDFKFCRGRKKHTPEPAHVSLLSNEMSVKQSGAFGHNVEKNGGANVVISNGNAVLDPLYLIPTDLDSKIGNLDSTLIQNNL